MNSLDDFAGCGFCGKVVYIPRISAPGQLKPHEVRERIVRTGSGPGVCPECGKTSTFVTRRNALYAAEREKPATPGEAPKA